jgi:hypothetical protein
MAFYVDPIRNLTKVTVLTGYDSTSTTVVLASGEGSKLPDPATYGAFNLVWYNSTDYNDPADDPYVEIIRCTARTSDTLTVERAQDNTTAQNHNIVAKTYKMKMAVTRKIIEDLRTPILVDPAGYSWQLGVDASGSVITTLLGN